MFKKIKRLYDVQVSQMVGDGFKVYNYFPRGATPTLKEVSPFLMLDYNAPFVFPPSDHSKGVGAHPHRGFETVTIVYEGSLQHRDSTGSGGIIEKDDIQWMTAASGVMHEEFHTREFSEKGGELHAIQLWVNLPSKFKMTPPKYQTLKNKDIPVYTTDDGSLVRVIAGRFKGTKGIAHTFSPVEMYDIRLKKDCTVEFELPSRYNTMLLITKGSIIINEEKNMSFKDFALFKNEGDLIKIKALEDSFIMVLSGDPILESVVSYGPFVMNTKEEIMQAYTDFEAGKFGTL